MPDRLTETEMTESLDKRGRLTTACNPGVYALESHDNADDSNTHASRVAAQLRMADDETGGDGDE